MHLKKNHAAKDSGITNARESAVNVISISVMSGNQMFFRAAQFVGGIDK